MNMNINKEMTRDDINELMSRDYNMTTNDVV